MHRSGMEFEVENVFTEGEVFFDPHTKNFAMAYRMTNDDVLM